MKYDDFILNEQQMLKKADSIMDRFKDNVMMGYSIDGIYPEYDVNRGWETGFWSGILWICYELSDDEKYKLRAMDYVDKFYDRIENKLDVNHHDLGFLYSLSCVSAYKITGDEKAKKAGIMAAEQLLTRYNKEGGFLQAWGNVGDDDNNRLITDSLLNIPLLYWASEVTGDNRFRKIADRHYKTAIENVIRADYTTHHTYFFDKETGQPLYGKTAQGASDESVWARGQAWAIYGTAINYKYNPSEKTKELFNNVLNKYLSLLPKDGIPFWDMIFKDADAEAKDSSAAAIVAAGVLQMANLSTGEESERLKNIACKILSDLSKGYATKTEDKAEGFLLHATYDKPRGVGVDECNIWGDYFYAEALLRLKKPDWNPYW